MDDEPSLIAPPVGEAVLGEAPDVVTAGTTEGEPSIPKASTGTTSRRLPSPRPLTRLIPFFRPYAGRMVVAAVCLLAAVATALYFPVVVGSLLDTAFENGGRHRLDQIALGLIGLFGVQALMNFTQVYLLTSTTERVIARLRENLFAHLVRLSPAFFTENPFGRADEPPVCGPSSSPIAGEHISLGAPSPGDPGRGRRRAPHVPKYPTCGHDLRSRPHSRGCGIHSAERSARPARVSRTASRRPWDWPTKHSDRYGPYKDLSVKASRRAATPKSCALS